MRGKIKKVQKFLAISLLFPFSLSALLFLTFNFVIFPSLYPSACGRASYNCPDVHFFLILLIVYSAMITRFLYQKFVSST